jgi:G:T-mismatch repair DNA endonuclease (very short patch repair protein)
VFVAEIINPEARKRKLTCSSCGISYSARDYKILYESHKIIYFKYKNKIYCHECLWKLVKAAAKGKVMSFSLINADYEYKCIYDPHEDGNDEDTPFSDLF